MLYKNAKDVITSVEIKQEEGLVKMLFSADCGKFGTDEILDIYEISPEELLGLLQKNYLINEIENNKKK